MFMSCIQEGDLEIFSLNSVVILLFPPPTVCLRGTQIKHMLDCACGRVSA